jgi:hypothetical protein
MSGVRARVFVSSVVDGFLQYREAARRGIQAAAADPVLVNEDQVASGKSSRNACLDAVDSCDIFVLLIGQRGGWTTPSGKLVVEEEYEQARRKKLPILVFLEDVDRDPEADRLARLVSDYTSGQFRRTFKSVHDLEGEVKRAVEDAARVMSQPQTSSEIITKRLGERARERRDPTLRFVLAPERDEEVITPMRIESSAFVDRVYEIGHAGGVKLFSYSQSKEHRVQGGLLIIDQDNPNGRHDARDPVRATVAEQGIVEIDVGVHSKDASTFANMVVLTTDVAGALRRCFAFVGALYHEIDPHGRHQRFIYGVSLIGMAYRKISKEPAGRGPQTVSMRGDEPIVAFQGVRSISRDDLSTPGEEIDRVVTLLERAGRG